MIYKRRTQAWIEQVLDELFPIRYGGRKEETTSCGDLDELKQNLIALLDTNPQATDKSSVGLAEDFAHFFPGLKRLLLKDVQATYQGDPASTSEEEIIMAYPGFQAMACYRIAHHLWLQGVRLLPRVITEYAHSETGIDIHPGAAIGEDFCIDHGTGIVIGETAVIGDRVKIYQGVTLGALSVPNRQCCKGQRHPTIGSDVVIYAQAIILGGDTHIGDGSVIGGNVWITKSVPSNSRIYFDSDTSTVRLSRQHTKK